MRVRLAMNFRISPRRLSGSSRRSGGFSLVELLTVILIMLIVAAFAIPTVRTVLANSRLRSSAADLSALIQMTRTQAARNNSTFTVGYASLNGANVAFVDKNHNGLWQSGESLVQFSGAVNIAAAPPSGAGGQPLPYVLTGDSGAGSYTNPTILGFSPRGFPCAFDPKTNPPTCATPAATNFVYYLTDSDPVRPRWIGVVVTKSGRSRVITWNGSAWQ